MLNVPNAILLWELYNYYSILSILYNSYWYASMSLYYYRLLKNYVGGTKYIPKTDIQLQTFEEWEIIDII